MNKVQNNKEEITLNHNTNAFESLSVPKALSKFILPAVISQLATLILNLTDAFFVGRTGDTFQISAMTVTLPLVMTMTVTATIFGAGGNANVAASLGTKNPKRAKTFSVFAIYTAITVIAVISLIIFLFEKQLLGILGADENSYRFCQGYVLWVLHVACVPMVFSQVMAQLFTAEGETKLASIGIAGAGLLNVVLDPIFIFVFKQGIAGAGMATCISNYCSMAFFLFQYYKRRKVTVISLNPLGYSANNGICKSVLSIGIPAGLSIFLMNCVDFLRNYLLGIHGTQADLAAWGVVQKLGNAFLQIAIGIEQGVRPLISYNYNAALGKRTKSLINGSMVVMEIYTSACFCFVMLFPNAMVHLFLPIADVMPVAVGFLRIYIFSIFGIGFLELFNAIFQAMGQWKTATVGIVIGKIVLMVPALLIFSKIWNVTGIIAAQPFAETLTVVILAIAYIRFIRKKKELFF